MSEHDDHRRLRRFDIPGHARALTFSCFHRRAFLSEDRSREWFGEAVNRARELHGFRVWAWVIMPEHVHLLFWPRNDAPAVGPVLTSIKQSVSRKAIMWGPSTRPGFDRRWRMWRVMAK